MNGEWGIWMGARDMDEVVETDEVGDGRHGWCQRVGIFFEIGRKGTKDEKSKALNNVLLLIKNFLFLKKKKKHLHCELSVIYTKKHLFWYFMNVSTLNVNCQISPIFSKCIKDFNFWDSWFRKKWLNILLIFNLYVYKSTEKQIIDINTLITEIQKAKKIEPGVSLSCSNKNIAFIKKRHITNNKLWMTCWINFWYRPKF